MNYRRGLQRIYAVFTVAWVVIVGFMVASDRWMWERWRITPITWAEMAKEYGGIEVVPGQLQFGNATDKIAIPKSTMVAWILALGVPLPLIGYFLLFYIVPWVYRGFSP